MVDTDLSITVDIADLAFEGEAVDAVLPASSETESKLRRSKPDDWTWQEWVDHVVERGLQ